jgi:hypothetical protein
MSPEKSRRACLSALVVDVEHDLGGAEHVPGIDEGQLHAIGDDHGALVAEGDELPQAVLRIDHGVAGREQREVVLLPVAVQPGDVASHECGRHRAA